jgi:DedD protein
MDKALRQRLVGASVLIALAVIVLPMLLGGRPEGNIRESSKIALPPQPPNLSFESRRYPVGEQATGAAVKEEAEDVTSQLPVPSNSVTSKPASADGSVEQEEGTIPVKESNALPESDRVAQTGESTDDDGTDKSSSASENMREIPDLSSESGRYIVQVASFGSADNANRLAGSLQEYGYAVMMDTVKSDVGVMNRVRVGPFDSESSANQAVSRLNSKIDGIRPRVIDLQPESSAQVTQPEDPLVRWVVQVGSFSNASNAENLVASLRSEGLSAYQETVSSSSSIIYRVRVGPILEREEAIRIEQQVRNRLGLDGVVMISD